MEVILNFITAIGTVITTILAIYAARKYIFKEVYYGDKAVDMFEELELKDKDLIDSYPFDGGNKIFPQIVIERRIFKKKITYFFKDGDKRMVKVWYLK